MVPAPDQQLAHELRDLVATLNRNLRKQLGNAEQLSVAEENVIRSLLASQEMLPSELCTQLNISSQFMSQVLKRLQKLGYISRKSSATDKRKSLVLISKQGLHTIQQRRKQKEDLLAFMLASRFNKQQKSQISHVVKLLSKLYD